MQTPVKTASYQVWVFGELAKTFKSPFFSRASGVMRLTSTMMMYVKETKTSDSSCKVPVKEAS